MERRQFTAGVLWCGGMWGGMSGRTALPIWVGLAALAGWTPAESATLGASEAARGVRSALDRGVRAAVSQLGRADGFLGDARVRVPLPDALQRAAKLFKATGQGKRLQALETAMNRAAEAAVPAGQAVLLETINQLTVDDALALVRGGSDTAITEFFAQRTRAPLTERFLPIVTTATEKVLLAARYNEVAGRAAGLGLVRAEQANLQQYVTGKALDGLFLIVGEEEKKLRADPVKAGSELLRRVFGRS